MEDLRRKVLIALIEGNKKDDRFSFDNSHPDKILLLEQIAEAERQLKELQKAI